MIENINEKKLQEIINYMVGQNVSIGVHGISVYHADHEDKETEPKEILNSIMTEGLKMSNIHGGLTGTIRFLNVEDCAHDILNYFAYQSEDKDNIVYKVICAIPEIMEDKNGEKYYLGKYDKFKQLGKDNFKVHGLPMHDLKILPKEFIVGFIAQKVGTNEAAFVANKEYYNIQNEEKKRDIENAFLQRLKSNKDLLALNKNDFEKVTSIFDIYSKFGREVPNEYYLKTFLETYGLLAKEK